MLLASVDLGSNSFRLEIGRVDADRILTQNYWKETVRLSAGLDQQNALTEQCQNKALNVLARFHELIALFPPSHVRAVGTQALRSASNADEFLKKAQQVLGFPIEILPGQEEARLIFEGCSYRLPYSEETRLIIDIGGGSTEFALGYKHQALRCASFHIGCVNTTLACFPNGELSKELFDKAVLFAKAELHRSRDEFHQQHFQQAYGSSGTMEALECMSVALGLTSPGEGITLEHLSTMTDKILCYHNIRDLVIDSLPDSRKEVIIGGLAVLTAVFQVLGLKTIQACSGALRVGLLYNLLERKTDKDIRESSASGLLTMLAADRTQADRMQHITLMLLQRIWPNCPAETARLLGWSALLHEVGATLSHSKYHYHSAYIIRHSDLAGFSRSNQEFMANLVLAQRGNLNKVSSFVTDTNNARLVLCLRLARIFIHHRQDTQLPDFQLSCNDRHFCLALPPLWLEQHPLTHLLLETEVSLWNTVKYHFTLSEFKSDEP